MSVSREVLRLPLGEVHLWFCFHDDVGDESLNGRYRTLLSFEELRRMASFHFAHDRHRFLVTRILVRTTLSRYAAVSPEAWRFGQNRFGRPHLIDPGLPETRALSFNLSHTRGFVVLGVTRCAALGVDTESLHREATLRMATRIFTAAEVTSLRVLTPARRAIRFFELWTLKESYIKARGMGLQIPLGQFGFDLDRGARIDIYFDANLEDIPDRWELRQARPSEEHVVSICVERISGTSPALVFREVLPLTGEIVCGPSAAVPAGVIHRDRRVGS